MRGSLRIFIRVHNGYECVVRVWRVHEATTGVAKVKVIAILTLPTGATDGAQTVVAVHIQMDRLCLLFSRPCFFVGRGAVEPTRASPFAVFKGGDSVIAHRIFGEIIFSCVSALGQEKIDRKSVV